MSALLLRASSLLRFHPWEATSAWGTVEAVAGTRIFFTAWDGSDGGEDGGRAELTGMPLGLDQVGLSELPGLDNKFKLSLYTLLY